MSLLGLLLVILLIVILVNGAGGWIGGPWYGRNPTYVGGGLGTILVIVLVLVLLGRL